MNMRIIVAAALLVAGTGGHSLAQETAESAIRLPEACLKAAQMPGGMGDMGMGKMMEAMQQHMGGSMSEATRGYMQAMTEMHMPMMQGAMAQDADVAFNCSMIAHHLGAIARPRSNCSMARTRQPRRWRRRPSTNSRRRSKK